MHTAYRKKHHEHDKSARADWALDRPPILHGVACIGTEPVPAAMAAVVIRPAEPADSEALFEMTRELCEFEKLLHEFTSTQTLLHDALFGDDPAAEALIAVVNGRVAGYALWFGTLSTFTGHRGLYLEDLYVRAPYRGSGIGTKLLRAVAAVAGQESRVRMEWTVLEWNVAAKEFYKRMGAEIEPDWRVVRAMGSELAALAQQ